MFIHLPLGFFLFLCRGFLLSFLKTYLSIGLFSVCSYICLRFCCQCISIAILVSRQHFTLAMHTTCFHFIQIGHAIPVGIIHSSFFISFSFFSSDNPVPSLCYAWNLCIKFISNVIYSEGLTIDDNFDVILNCYCISWISWMRIIVILNGCVLYAINGFPKSKEKKNESNFNWWYDNDTRSRKESWQFTHKLRASICVQSFQYSICIESIGLMHKSNVKWSFGNKALLANRNVLFLVSRF